MNGEVSCPRELNPADIDVPPGYNVEVYAQGLTTPISIYFNDSGDLLIGDAGVASGNGKLLRYDPTGITVLAEGFNPPVTGVTYHDDSVYVSHRGFITRVMNDGTTRDVLAGLPAWGDFQNNRVVFGPEGKMYFGQGTATNTGVVGIDNSSWVLQYPFFHDYAGAYVPLIGQNFETRNFLTEDLDDIASTGAYSPFGVPNEPCTLAPAVVRASGSVLRTSPDGSDLELVAWGFRNPFGIGLTRDNCLYMTDHGMDVRGSRPVANSPDAFWLVRPGVWYGWPDYTGGMPVTLPQFKPEDLPQPRFLLARHPMYPPRPLTTFVPHSANMGFDFNYSPSFGPVGDAYVAQFGSEAPETTGGKPLPAVGHRVVQVDMHSGRVVPFAINKSGYPASYTGGGGLERPIDVRFGPDGNMYIADWGYWQDEKTIPGSGVIWRVTRTG